MGAKNTKKPRHYYNHEDNIPEVLQRSKKDDDLNLKNSQKIQKIAYTCSLIDFSNPLPEHQMSHLSTQIAECLITMLHEYPDTDQFNQERRLLIEIFRKSKSLQKVTYQKYHKLYKQGKIESRDHDNAAWKLHDLLNEDIEHYIKFKM